MKILAVSDTEDKVLESALENYSDRFKDINYIFSCGDLPKKYLEYITDASGKSLYFVSGNHFGMQLYAYASKRKIAKKLYLGKGMRLHSGGVDMHGRVEVLDGYIVAGFGGSMRYNPGFFQFEEAEMEKLVNKAKFEIIKRRVLDFLLFRKRKEIIVISHAPPQDIHDKDDRCHKGFKCFKKFLFNVKPVLWLHGHIHFEGQNNRQQTVLDNTLVVNVYSSKIINIDGKQVTVKPVCADKYCSVDPKTSRIDTVI
ncbi:MAG: metallophosphoesterase [Endomicrobium sp.]|jgi:Icc-related predicted phosphoesterase|nr:metallophosphoesterase [Endomicrobium sp.]